MARLSSSARAHVRAQDRTPQPPPYQEMIFLLTGEPEARMLAAGEVPESIAKQAQAALDWEFDIRAKTPLPAGRVDPAPPKRSRR